MDFILGAQRDLFQSQALGKRGKTYEKCYSVQPIVVAFGSQKLMILMENTYGMLVLSAGVIK